MTKDRLDEQPTETPSDLRFIEARIDAEGSRLRARASSGLEDRTFARTRGIVVSHARGSSLRPVSSLRFDAPARFFTIRRLAIAAGFAVVVGTGAFVVTLWPRPGGPSSSQLGAQQLRQLEREIDAFLSSTDVLVEGVAVLPVDAQDLDSALASLEQQANRFWANDDDDVLNGGSL